ncbi:MAG: fluoride efflux transporter CrcB [Limisphaerales bacterium]
MSALLVFLGSGLGGVARWLLAGWIGGKAGPGFPWGTLVVNGTGSFLIGLIATLTGPEGRLAAPLVVRQFFMLGFLGGYTTFSSFSLQTLQLFEAGQWARAGANVVGSVVLCLLAVALGHALALALNSGRGTG